MDNFLNLEPKPVPKNPSITVSIRPAINPDEGDMVYLSECVDPIFDMKLLSEGVATAMIIAAKYTETPVSVVFKDLVDYLEKVTQHHATIKRTGETDGESPGS